MARGVLYLTMSTPSTDPATVVRRAWSTFRLPALQAIVNATITQLEKLEPSDLLGRELSSLECQREHNPIAIALEVFSEELRDEAGIAGAHQRRIEKTAHARESLMGQPEAWAATFREASEKYRLAAARALNAALAEAPSPTAPAP
jgi:hypothetical protein